MGQKTASSRFVDVGEPQTAGGSLWTPINCNLQGGKVALPRQFAPKQLRKISRDLQSDNPTIRNPPSAVRRPQPVACLKQTASQTRRKKESGDKGQEKRREESKDTQDINRLVLAASDHVRPSRASNINATFDYIATVFTVLLSVQNSKCAASKRGLVG